MQKSMTAIAFAIRDLTAQTASPISSGHGGQLAAASMGFGTLAAFQKASDNVSRLHEALQGKILNVERLGARARTLDIKQNLAELQELLLTAFARCHATTLTSPSAEEAEPTLEFDLDFFSAWRKSNNHIIPDNSTDLATRQRAFLCINGSDNPRHYAVFVQVVIGQGLPPDIYHREILTYYLEDTVKKREIATFATLNRDLIETVWRGLTIQWDGHDFVGSLTEAAKKADLALCERVFFDLNLPEIEGANRHRADDYAIMEEKENFRQGLSRRHK
jgi:hypothetical protein